MRPRTPPSLPIILAIIALLLSALYVAGLIADWPAWLRGSNWVWVRRVPSPGGRFWLMPAALAVGLALAWLAGRGSVWSRRRTALLLAGLVILAPLLQLAVAAQHRAQPLSLVVMSAGGFWQEGVQIDTPLAFARQHAARMPGYADVHVRTQPPGWPLAYWTLARGFAHFPGLAEAVGGRVRRYDCVAPEFAGLDTAQLAAGSLRVVILFLSGLGVLPMYAIGRRFVGARAARLAAVGYGYLPALLVFTGRFDVAYALLALLAVWLALRAVVDGRREAAVALALLIAISSFFTFTALAIAGLALVVAASVWLGTSGWRDRRVVRLVGVGGAVAAAVLLFWGGLWLAGINGVEMWRVGQAIHREYRLNYPAWFLFNLYDLAVFMGLVPFVGAIGALLSRRLSTNGQRLRTSDELRVTSDELTGDTDRPTSHLRHLAFGWGAAVLLLNLSATVRAETGRLWLFLMPVGVLVGVGWFVEWWRVAGGSRAIPSASSDADSAPLSQRARGPETLFLALLPALLVIAYLTQSLVMGYLLGGRAGEAATPAPLWDVPGEARAVDYQLGEAVALRGYRVEPDADGMTLTLYWQALDFPRAESSVFVHALDAAGATVAQSDGPPAAVPMWCWVPGEVVADERRLATEDAAAFGVGLYDPLTGKRWPVQPATPDDRIVLPGAE